MFSDLAAWTNRKLRWWLWVTNIAVVLLSYIAPLITILVMCWSGKDGGEGGEWKIPITALVVFCAFVFALTHFLKGTIGKMSIYDNKSQTAKHILECVSRLIVPVTIIAISSIFATWLKSEIDFYNMMIIICLSFYCGGALIERLVLGFLDDEKSIREKAKEANAVSARQDIVKKR